MSGLQQGTKLPLCQETVESDSPGESLLRREGLYFTSERVLTNNIELEVDT